MNYRKIISYILNLTVLIILLLSTIAYFIPIEKLAAKAIEYNNFINTVLTFVLVVITGIYAMLTYKILLQSTAGIRSQIKPTIFIKLGKPEIKTRKTNNITLTYFYLKKSIIANYGKGVAINVNIQYYYPSRLDKKTNQIEGATTRHPHDPITLTSNEFFEDSLEAQIPDKIKKMDKNFLGIRISYEDSDRNLHQLNQTYQLNTDTLNDEILCYLFLTAEKLTILAHSDRKFTLDITEGVLGSEREKQEVIFSRKYY